MLFDQIPQRFLEYISAELKVNLGVVSASVKTPPSKLNRYTALRMVEHYLRNNSLIGTVESPREYFQGTIDARFAL
jgi:hypothetical protein